MRLFRLPGFGLAAAALAGLAVPAEAAPRAFTAQDRADTVCLIAISAILGSASAPGAQLEPGVKEGLSAVLTYFVGKLKGRHPDLTMTELLAPDYVLSLESEIASSSQRCSQEAIEMGTDLQEAGRILMNLDKRTAGTF